MPKPPNPTAGLDRDYARYGKRRTGAPPLPSGPTETPLYAQRVFRARLGPILAASFAPAAGLAISLRFLLLVVLPDAFSTGGSDVRSDLGQAGIALVLGLVVIVPLAVFCVAALAGTAYREAATWMEIISPDERDSPRRARTDLAAAARVLGRAAWGIAAAPALGLVLILVGASVSRMDPYEDEVALISFLGLCIILIGGIVGLARLGRILLAVPIALAESIGAKPAMIRARDLTKTTRFGLAAARVDSAILGGVILALLLLGGFATIIGLLDVGGLASDLFDSPVLRLAVGEALGTLPLLLVFLFVGPYVSMLAAVTYFERRVAIEGLDIELMTARLETARRDAPSAGAR